MSKEANAASLPRYKMSTGRIQLDDLWQAGMPLPSGDVLHALAGRFAAVWAMPELAHARIGYNPRMRSALGRAFCKEGRIELNPLLLSANPQEFLGTLAHELAHLAVHRRFGDVPAHGPHFRTLMSQLGLRGRATTRLAANPLRRTRARYLYLHVCQECGRHFTGRSVRRDCYCRHCGPGSRWDVFRAPQTPEGLALLASHAKTIAQARLAGS